MTMAATAFCARCWPCGRGTDSLDLNKLARAPLRPAQLTFDGQRPEQLSEELLRIKHAHVANGSG